MVKNRQRGFKSFIFYDFPWDNRSILVVSRALGLEMRQEIFKLNVGKNDFLEK